MGCAQRKALVRLLIAYAGVMAAAGLVTLFNRTALMRLPLAVRMLAMPICQWLLLLVPGILMRADGERLRDLGFSVQNLPMQIAAGVLLALAMSAILTVLPILLGLKEFIGNAQYTMAWQFVYDFGYKIAAVAFSEELIFRGYLFRRMLEIRNNRALAIAVTSVLFGLFHIFGGNPIQVGITALIGALFCLCREKIPNCTLLILILAHGMYDALIPLWCLLL